MRKPADKVIAPVLLDHPVLSHVDIILKTRLLYQFYCINKLTCFPTMVACLPAMRVCEDCRRMGRGARRRGLHVPRSNPSIRERHDTTSPIRILRRARCSPQDISQLLAPTRRRKTPQRKYAHHASAETRERASKRPADNPCICSNNGIVRQKILNAYVQNTMLVKPPHADIIANDYLAERISSQRKRLEFARSLLFIL